MKIPLIVLALWGEIAFAQTAAAPGGLVTKVIHVRYGDPRKLANLASSGTMATVNSDDALRIVVLKGDAAAVAPIEQLIRELDVPASIPAPRNVELVVSVVGASSNPDLLPVSAISQGMAAVIKQLQVIFPYKNYQLLTSMLLRSREGARAENHGIIKSIGDSKNPPSTYAVDYASASFSSQAGRDVVYLKGFNFRLSSTTRSLPGFDVLIGTDVDLREGQKVVVGKADMENSDSALFVVLTARMVE